MSTADSISDGGGLPSFKCLRRDHATLAPMRLVQENRPLNDLQVWTGASVSSAVVGGTQTGGRSFGAGTIFL